MNRYLIVYSPENNNDVKKIRKQYNDNLYQFHKRYTKLKIIIDDKIKELYIDLIGFDKSLKKKYKRFNVKNILKTIDNMPMGKFVQKKSLSLYANYKPKTTIKGLGFKNKTKALETIKKIKNMDYRYKINVLNTMINRAKYHPHFNESMALALKILENYKKKIMINHKKQRIQKKSKNK